MYFFTVNKKSTQFLLLKIDNLREKLEKPTKLFYDTDFSNCFSNYCLFKFSEFILSIDKHKRDLKRSVYIVFCSIPMSLI